MKTGDVSELATTRRDSPIVLHQRRRDLYDSPRNTEIWTPWQFVTQKPSTLGRMYSVIRPGSSFTAIDAISGYRKFKSINKARKRQYLEVIIVFPNPLEFVFLQNAPATFEWAKDVAHSFVKWQSALVYQDVIVVFSKSFKEQMQYIRIVLKRLHDWRETLKRKKWSFFAEQIDYLRYVIRLGRLELACIPWTETGVTHKSFFSWFKNTQIVLQK